MCFWQPLPVLSCRPHVELESTLLKGGLYRGLHTDNDKEDTDNGKEDGKYYLEFRVQGSGSKLLEGGFVGDPIVDSIWGC